jgi:hypothetical protein
VRQEAVKVLVTAHTACDCQLALHRGHELKLSLIELSHLNQEQASGKCKLQQTSPHRPKKII